jgi:hypothetical protein
MTSPRRDEDLSGDMLNMKLINSLPQLFVFFSRSDKYGWPLYDIDVQTGCLRIDVCGLLEVKHIGEVIRFEDADGVKHDPDTFYLDYQP